MATTVYTQKEILLQDDTPVILRPLPIARLKRFMASWNQVAKSSGEEDNMNILVNCAGIAIENNFKGKFESLKATGTDAENGEFLSPEYKSYCEETLDTDTIYEIMFVCGGINLRDPNLIKAAEEILANQEAGTA